MEQASSPDYSFAADVVAPDGAKYRDAYLRLTGHDFPKRTQSVIPRRNGPFTRFIAERDCL